MTHIAFLRVFLSCRRKIYDDTGATSEDLVGANFDDLRDYFRAVFKRVTEDDIDTFAVRARRARRCGEHAGRVGL